jgi:FKBP-type peptidyl-prolyl cis-trans isomerase
MSVGEKYEFTIPSQLGYGERGIPGHIPGNSVLIFVVELLGIE